MTRGVAGALVLAAAVYAGARGVGGIPPVGPLLDPAHGVWAHARPGPDDVHATIPGLAGPVEVRYDRRGVPHIFARTEADAYRALGYAVARDRLFQLYLQTRAASGRLTELGGASLLGQDRQMRRLGLPRAAERTWAALGDTSRSARIVRAYADGVNAYIRALPPARYPLEFRLLGLQPTTWRPVNSMYLLARMGWTLAYLAPELARAAAAARVGDAAAAALFPAHSPIQQPIVPTGDAAPAFEFHPLPPPGAPDTTATLLAGAGRTFFPGAGDVAVPTRARASNNWVVAPRRTANGYALLAGDPHLELSLPSIWYEAQLVVPGKLDVYGVTIPGAPGIILGFNQDVAWSFTNTGADVLDFYRETVDDTLHPTRYLLDGTWRPLERRVERYRAPDGHRLATDTLYFTHRGPMRREPGGWVSMRWTVLQRQDALAGILGMSHARSAEGVEAAMSRSFWAPAQNVAAADRDGHIAIRSVGHFPIRPDDGSGMVVRDGSTTRSDWTGFARVAELPEAHDPTQGFLASANQDPVTPGESDLYLGAGGVAPWRAIRINRLLRTHDQVTPDDMRRFQTDVTSERARLFVPYFVAAAKRVAASPAPGVDTATLGRAARLLDGWDRRFARDDERGVLFVAAMRALTDRTWDELLAPAARGTLPHRVATPSEAVLAELCDDPTSPWWDDHRTPVVEHRDDILAASLVAGYQAVRARYGAPETGGWRWDRVQHANIYHLLRIPALSALQLPPPGGPSTLSPSSGTGTAGSSWRMVVELAPQIRAWGALPGGESGDPASPHYRDHLAGWIAGSLDRLYLPTAPAGMDSAHTEATVILTPEARR